MADQSNVKLPAAEMASVHQSERREERFALNFDVQVSGIDSEGSVFHFTVQTRNVSQWGCGFVSPIELRKDDIVALRVVSPEEPGALQRPAIRFQVVRAEPERGGWGIGAWKMDQDDAWGIELDKVTQPQRAAVEFRRRETGAGKSDEDGDE
ncbi:MAG TPA: PilZ domain-containing protein [Candidatus Acidoferrum sp.]|nr:PilZ domain-containing protein [Candidatus Acidoferrum sp.]